MTSATLFPDTALLLAYQNLDTLDWERLFGVDRATVVLAPSVLRELGRLKQQAQLSPDAERAADLFAHYVRLISQQTPQSHGVVFRTVPDPQIDFEAERLNPGDPGDQLIATVIAYQQSHALESVVLLSERSDTSERAERAGIDVMRLPAYLHITASIDTPTRTSGSSSGDGMAPRPLPEDETHATSRIPPLDRLAAPSPLYVQLPEPKLPSLPPIPIPRHSVTPLTTVSSADVDLATTDTSMMDELPVSRIEDIPEAIVQVRLPDPVPAPQPTPSPLPEAPRPAPKPSPAGESPPMRTGYVEFFSASPESEPVPEPVDPGPPRGPSLTRTVPELRLAFGDGTYRSTAHIKAPAFPSIEEITAELTRVRRDYPKLPFLRPASPADASPQPGGVPFHERKNERIRRYNAALDAYYASLEKYLHDAAEHANLQRRTATLELNIINDAPVMLKSLYITLRFPPNVRLFTEDSVPELPIPPTPPARPNLDTLFDTIRLPAVPVPSELRQSTNILLRSRSLSPLEIRWNKGWDVLYSLREMERNHAVSFNPLLLSFNSFDEASSLRIPYRITVASQSQEERGQLEVLVRKVIA